MGHNKCIERIMTRHGYTLLSLYVVQLRDNYMASARGNVNLTISANVCYKPYFTFVYIIFSFCYIIITFNVLFGKLINKIVLT